MNSLNINNILRFVLLIIAQALVFNQINFMGSINPYPYVFFILMFPVKKNRTAFIFISFMLGLFVDFFSDSGGVHAAASVTIAYLRPPVLKFSFGMMYENHNIKFSNTEISNRILYFTVLIVIHHLLMFTLEIFNMAKVILILQKTLFSSIFTIILCILISVIFNNKRR